MPPSVLRMTEFWDQLIKTANGWVAGAYGVESAADITSREVISGREAREMFESDISFIYASRVVPGLCAIVMDPICVSNYAAVRMSEPVERVKEIPQTFVKLLCEEPSTRLWRAVATEVIGKKPHEQDAATNDVSSATGHFAFTSNYLDVGLKIPIGEQEGLVHLLFDIDAFRQYSTEYQKAIAERKAQLGKESHDTLRKTIRRSSITVDAVLDTVTMSFAAASRLKVGQVIDLPNAELEKLTLAAKTINGNQVISNGEMGVWKQNRALKLSEPLSESFMRNVAEF